MKNADVFNELGKLSLKYANMGLTIDFKFDRFGLILKGWLDITLNTVDVYKFNRVYSYQILNSLSDSIDIEDLVDEFKNELWESYVRSSTGQAKLILEPLEDKAESEGKDADNN